jgi:hypothetical protein
MIKFHVRKRKSHFYGFSLSAESIELLKQGKVVIINMRDVGVPNTHVLLFSEGTEEDTVKELKEHGVLPTNFNTSAPGSGETRVFRDLRERKSGGHGV